MLCTKNNTTFGEKHEIIMFLKKSKYILYEKVFLCETVMLFYCYVV